MVKEISKKVQDIRCGMMEASFLFPTLWLSLSEKCPLKSPLTSGKLLLISVKVRYFHFGWIRKGFHHLMHDTISNFSNLKLTWAASQQAL